MHRFSLFTALLLAVGGCKNGDPTCSQLGLDEIQWFEDQDRDGYGNANNFIVDCEDLEGNGPLSAVYDPSLEGLYVKDDTDCDDLRPQVYPTAPELCDGLDNNCNVAIDDGLFYSDFWLDQDNDGFGNPSLQVQACDPPEGAATRPGDCNDSDPELNPDAVEICDGIDNDCDGFTDDDDDLPLAEGGVDLQTGLPWYPDADQDSYGSWVADSMVMACEAPLGYVADSSDCNDADQQINPDNQEVCNGIDDDCDQLYDDSDPDLDLSTRTQYFIDEDADGYGSPDASIFTCTVPWFYALTDDDCDDGDPELWSPTDTVWLDDSDGDGYGDGEPSEPGCTPPTANSVPAVRGVDCVDDDDAINPGALELCDTIDNDCDGLIDDDDLWIEPGGVDFDSMSLWYADADGDGFGDREIEVPACIQPAGMADNPDDCDDTNEDISPATVEICNGIDDDCDFLADDLDDSLDIDSGTLWVIDADGDGWGDLDVVYRACEAPFGYTDRFGDCDDEDPFLGVATVWWFDADGDGQGAGDIVIPAACDAPADGWVPFYVDSLEDCAPNDPTAMSGPEICYDGIDQGCDGFDFTTNGDCTLDLPEACPQAQAFTPIIAQAQQVVITGTLADAIDDFNTEGLDNGTCVADWRSAAGDEMVPITVPAGETLEVTLSISGGDSILYLLASCDSLQSCLALGEAAGSNGSVERVEYTNSTADDQTLYAVLDGFEFEDARSFTLTIGLL